jgi:lipopolysaccharide/colanic/teichoic acid biosynthesis glycosyltransferase
LVEARRARGVLALQHGITGWAQVNDIDMSDIERLVQYDDEYRHRRSVLFDLGILLATVRGRGRADRTAA